MKLFAKNTLNALLTLSLVLTLALPAASEEVKKEKSEVYGDVAVNESLKKLLEVPGVGPKYKTCKSKDTPIDKMADCIWNALSDPEKKRVQETYANEIKKKDDKSSDRSPASNSAQNEDSKAGLTTTIKNVGVDYGSDPSVAALSKFYGEKLDQILDPNKALTEAERKEGVILSVDHRKFIELYKSELGKTIISAFTSYCINTDPSTCCTDEDPKNCQGKRCTLSSDKDKQIEHRNKNIEDIKTGKLNLADGSVDSRKWQRCITDVPDVCEDPKSNEASKQQACVIVDFVKTARKNIILADKQKEFYDKLSKNSTPSIVSNIKVITDENKASADALLSMTSKDVSTTLKPTDEEAMKEMDKCYDKKSNKIVNADACKKFLSTNKETNDEALDEFQMRQLVHEKYLEEQLNSSDEKVKEYLKEEGFEDSEIQKLTENSASIEEIKKQILDRFKNEKKAIIKEMADKISSKTSSTDGKIDANSAEDRSKIQKIREEMASRSSDLANLVQFNNVISSYLTISDGSGKTERNTASLFAETSVMEEIPGGGIKQKIEQAKLSDKKNSAELNVDTLNQKFLEYNKGKND